MNNSLFAVPALAAVGCAALLAVAPRAQCGLAGEGAAMLAGADGVVYASRYWDPDGAGPLPQVVVFGGNFRVFHDVVADGVVLFDPATGACTGLGSPAGGDPVPLVRALFVTSTNELIAAGSFTTIGGVAAKNVARWDGTSWQPLGAGVPYPVFSLAATTPSDLVVGSQAIAGFSSVLQWNGTTWAPLGSVLQGVASAMVRMPNGDLVVGGLYLLGSSHVVRWDGSSWSQLGANFNHDVHTLLLDPAGRLLAGGAFYEVGGQPMNYVARWDGSAWSSLGSPLTGAVLTMSLAPNGHLFVGGNFPAAGSVATDLVGRWDGVSWSGVGNGLGTGSIANPVSVQTLLALPNGDVVAGGSFDAAFAGSKSVSRWDGSSWRQLLPGTIGPVHATAEAANGDLLVVGDFTRFEGLATRGVVRRSGGSWLTFGAGTDGPVYAVVPLPNGEFVIGGDFTSVDGVPATRVARWDGSSWRAMALGLGGAVQGLAIGPFGEVLAGGLFPDGVARWDGVTWNGTGLTVPILPFTKVTLLPLPNGHVLVGGSYVSGIKEWDGATWTQVTTTAGSGPMAMLGNGDLVVASGGQVRVWNGTAMQNLGPSFAGSVFTLLRLPDDSVLAGGTISASGATPILRLARWDGTTWRQVGAGANGSLQHLRWRADGTVWAAGAFTMLDGVASGGLGTFTSTCAASTVTIGSGCTGSGGNNVLTAIDLAWLGGDAVSRATGMPATGLVLEVLGLAPASLPLGTVWQEAGVGCDLLASPDILRVYLSSPSLDFVLALPPASSLVGVSFHQQAVALELDALGALVAVTSSNALQATMGVF